jgi:PST family polysaccharide transporter
MTSAPTTCNRTNDVTESSNSDLGQNTYGQILRSTAQVGGGAVVAVALGVVRTKVLAVLLGPGGMGLFSLFNSIADLSRSMLGMGIGSSGVRQIAEAVGTGDRQRIAKTAAVLRRLSLVLGTAGAIAIIILARPVSRWTFNSESYYAPTVLLSLAVLCQIVSDSRGALLQGLRKIPELTMATAIGAVLGTAASLLLVFFYGESGVVPALISVAVLSLGATWWYSRGVAPPVPHLSRGDLILEASGLLRLGMVFMLSSLMMTGVAYLVRALVLRTLGFHAVGLYQSSYTVGGIYVAFILQAMAADFYPRLTAGASDDRACSRLVNEQAEVSLLMTGPGIVATMTFAPLVLTVLYSREFDDAAAVLRWICLGMTLRVMSWPMAFVLPAKGCQGRFFCGELSWALVHLGLAWFGIAHLGVEGAGMAFFGAYLFYTILIYSIVHRLVGFRWSAVNRTSGLLMLCLVGTVFLSFQVLPRPAATMVGSVGLVVSCVYSARGLATIVDPQRVPARLRWVCERLRRPPGGRF